MTERERLIGLLVNAHRADETSKTTLEHLVYMADHLIANGVTFGTDNNVGRWIIHSSGRGSEVTNWAECSECHVCGSPNWKVCPVCETRMVTHNAINIEERE